MSKHEPEKPKAKEHVAVTPPRFLKKEPEPDVRPPDVQAPMKAPEPVAIMQPHVDPPADLKSEPVERPPDPPAPTKPAKGLTPEEEIAKLRGDIASAEARIWELEHPVVEYPKWVKGHLYESAEQEKAGGKVK